MKHYRISTYINTHKSNLRTGDAHDIKTNNKKTIQNYDKYEKIISYDDIQVGRKQ